jgi:hypothetical protein
MSALLVFCTVPAAAADRLARLLVEERLAACVNLTHASAHNAVCRSLLMGSDVLKEWYCRKRTLL